jgi:uncharacterized membrane protein YuzA (DUF378 family)
MLTKVCAVLTVLGAVSWVTYHMLNKDLVSVTGMNVTFARAVYIATAMAAVYTLVFSLNAKKNK